MSFQENLAFLSLLLQDAREEAADRLKRGVVQPGDFLHFTLQHHLQLTILPLLDGTLRKGFAEDGIRQVKTVCRRQWAMQEALIHELGHLA